MTKHLRYTWYSLPFFTYGINPPVDAVLVIHSLNKSGQFCQVLTQKKVKETKQEKLEEVLAVWASQLNIQW